MSLSAMKQALEALEEIYRTGDTQAFDLCYAPNVSPALRQAIAEAEKQEPVGYVSESGKGAYLLLGVGLEDDTPLYAAPPKREWVGLHEHELQVLEYNDPSGERLKLAKAVEAKLKGKNT